MSLSKKYDIPEEKVKKLIDDGWLSCSVPMYEKIYKDFQNSMAIGGKTQTAIFLEVAEKNNVSEKTVQKVVYKFR